MKKVLMALLMLVVVIAVGAALYFLFFVGPAVPPEEGEVGEVVTPGVGLPTAQPGAPITPTAPPEIGLPEVDTVAQGGITAVTPVVPAATGSATLGTNGTLNYYNKGDGKFYRVMPDGTVKSLSNKAFINVDKATFAPNGNSAIIEYPDGANIFYDFNSGRQVTLPQHWEDFDFSPQGDRIISKSVGIDPDSRYLVTSAPDGSGARAFWELGENQDKVQVNWSPNNQIIATSETGRAFGLDRQEIYFVGLNNENFKSMVVEGLDFRPQWAPDGEQLLYSVAGSLSDWKPLLWVVDASGDNIGLNRRIVNVNTWADKCTYSGNDTLYCAVPTDLPRGAGLQPAVADTIPDEIYRIDMTTGLQTRVAIPEGNHTVEDIMITPDGSKLYFTDKGTGVLNEIKLQP